MMGKPSDKSMVSAFTPSKQMKFSKNFNELLNVAEPIQEADVKQEDDPADKD